MCGIRIRFDQLVTVNFSDLLSCKRVLSTGIHIEGQPGCTYTVGTTEKDGWLGPTIFFPLHTQLPFGSLISEMQYIFLFNLTLITPVPEEAQHLYI